MKNSLFTVFLCGVLVVTAVLGQIPPADVDAVSTMNNPSTDSSGTTTWDCVYFGEYWQNDTNGDGKADKGDEKEAIKWRVLSVKDSEAILMAEQCLDCVEYNAAGENLETIPATWESSSLRAWLNGEFYQNAFSHAEQSVIKTTMVVNEDNPLTGAEGGNDTQDKVYLLSIEEAGMEEYGFESGFDIESEARCAKATDYASNKFDRYDDNASWLLRSQGYTQEYAAYIEVQGKIKADLGVFNHVYNGVRPVIQIDLSASSMWQNAGTVKAAKTPTPTKTTTPTKKTTPVPKVTEPPKKPAPTTTMKPGTKKAISSFKDLQKMENIPSGNYYLKKDITVPKNAKLFCDYPFTGTLDGKGHKIKGYQFRKKYVLGKDVKVELTDGGGHDIIIETPDAGLFSEAKNATFKNISMTNVNINVQMESYARVGALVSQTENCTFTNVHTSGRISVRSTRESPLRYRGTFVGGIVGTGTGTLNKCSNSAKITVNCRSCSRSYGVEVGGLAGRYIMKKMKDCTNSGNISVSGYAGDFAMIKVAGLVGSSRYSSSVGDGGSNKLKITNCTNSGKVTLKPQGGSKNYETLKHLTRFGKDCYNSAGPITCGGVCAAGITDYALRMTSCGNTGKVKLDYAIEYLCDMSVAGLAGTIGKASKCYNKGAVSFSGRAKENGDQYYEVTNVAGLFGAYLNITQCYNKGKVSANVKNKIMGGIRVGGIAGTATSSSAEVKNNYNAGTVSLKSQGGEVAGIVGYYEGGYSKSARAKYNYNVGKIKGTSSSNVHKAAIISNTSDSEKVVSKRLTDDNYYKKQGSLKPYVIHVSWKKWAPKAKKVSRIKKASCPKLSSKYWIYSSKVKRLVLKNNNETKAVKKA